MFMTRCMTPPCRNMYETSRQYSPAQTCSGSTDAERERRARLVVPPSLHTRREDRDVERRDHQRSSEPRARFWKIVGSSRRRAPSAAPRRRRRRRSRVGGSGSWPSLSTVPTNAARRCAQLRSLGHALAPPRHSYSASISHTRARSRSIRESSRERTSATRSHRSDPGSFVRRSALERRLLAFLAP